MRHVISIGLALALAAAGCAVPDGDEAEPGAGEPGLGTGEGVEPALRLPVALPLEADLSPFERAVGERMDAVAAVTVEVQAWEGGVVVSHGSGVLVSPDGDVLTAAHVVRDPKRTYRVVLPGGQSRVAEVAARDEAHDAARLRAAGAPTPFVRLPARPRPAGEWVVCAGHAGTVAGDRLPTRSAGVIVERAFTSASWEWRKSASWHETLVKGPTRWGMIHVDCATAPGMSGGPVVTLDGELVGVVVATHGVASPIEAIRHLLPAASRTSVAAEVLSRPSPADAPAPVRGADGRPSRAATLDALFASTGVERSMVELESPRPFGISGRFPAVLVSSTGLAVVPAVRLTGLVQPDTTELIEGLSVVDHPGARCTEIVVVRDELALIRLSGLALAEGEEGAADSLRPVGPAGAVAPGAIVAAVYGSSRRSTGFVTAVDRRPGTVAPPAPAVPPALRGGCGHTRSLFQQAFPAVSVGAALAHDADMPRYGSLLVDPRGRPLALEVASSAEGVDFAVPWTDVLGRFDAWLQPRPVTSAPAER